MRLSLLSNATDKKSFSQALMAGEAKKLPQTEWI